MQAQPKSATKLADCTWVKQPKTEKVKKGYIAQATVVAPAGSDLARFDNTAALAQQACSDLQAEPYSKILGFCETVKAEGPAAPFKQITCTLPDYNSSNQLDLNKHLRVDVKEEGTAAPKDYTASFRIKETLAAAGVSEHNAKGVMRRRGPDFVSKTMQHWQDEPAHFATEDSALLWLPKGLEVALGGTGAGPSQAEDEAEVLTDLTDGDKGAPPQQQGREILTRHTMLRRLCRPPTSRAPPPLQLGQA
ncbi:hypothetical protein WJX73_007924 [Symbiochloris irregularis]|uniref:Uncharacterized protein n=1 Tax=Symbiochloris irregularis TaxID=706552 RepID=A0AAW1PEQ0_9CHLO